MALGLKYLLLISAFIPTAFINCLRGRDTIGHTTQDSCQPFKLRRYDINDVGYENYFHGWVDVQGQGAANDYCRVVGNSPDLIFACALAGTHGESEMNYKSGIKFDVGYGNTWYMKDEDGDGRDDYCRCVGVDPDLRVACTKAGRFGFYGSPEQGGQATTFIVAKNIKCNAQKVRPEFGRPL